MIRGSDFALRSPATLGADLQGAPTDQIQGEIEPQRPTNGRPEEQGVAAERIDQGVGQRQRQGHQSEPSVTEKAENCYGRCTDHDHEEGGMGIHPVKSEEDIDVGEQRDCRQDEGYFWLDPDPQRGGQDHGKM
ncbi:hypothetical protein AKJ50_00265 [candidate division MSBL1 archaeon SCGC-AAA382A13]|uniref:Uncharacterized protein n=1 Tax=candidate division MSBL1 archaeon SCGC-AAA382A13 TaxID=1698279 RepID=A0A133VGT7_9EURY|nr:hypothetical protein AKJ50_00265 [candidate division MSBL1 archaeon SCGC-AAA382A13]